MNRDTSAPGVGADPGMEVKMAPPSFPGIVDLAAGRPCDEAPLLALCDFVDARHDCSDFRLLVICKVLSAWGDLLTPATADRLRATVLGFKFWMDEPGDDGMCFWSENHQVIFATCELVAGQLFPDARFSSGGFTGRERRERGARKLRAWLSDRFAYGYTEWLSNTYYEEDAAPLAVLVDHAEDADIAAGATACLDLLFLDMAMHRFDGRLVASAGRAYEEQKKDPAAADVNDLLGWAFEEGAAYDPRRLSALVVLGERYRVPGAMRAIAAATGPLTVRATHGLDIDEVVGLVGAADDVERTGAFLWLMEAFVNPGAADLSARCLREWQMQRNTFLRPMGWVALLAGTGLAPAVMRFGNPAAQGIAIERANVATTRTPHWQLSAAQRYRPRAFGDQQSLWMAALPGDVAVFSTHPAAPLFEETARSFSPGPWTGNGINPDVVADGNLLLAVHDLRVRPGVLERPRLWRSHLWFPADRFDEVVRGERVVVGRRGDSLVGVVGLEPLVDGAPGELVQHGDLTAWAVACSDVGESGPAAAYAAALGRTTLVATRRLATWHVAGLPAGGGRRTLALHRDGPATVDGEELVTVHPRLEAPWGRVERFPGVVEVAWAGHRLRLERHGWGRTQDRGPDTPVGGPDRRPA